MTRLRGGVWIALCLVAFALGCNDRGKAPEPEPEPAAASVPADAATPDPATPALEAFDAQGDESAALRRLGAVPAWEAVVDRDRMLARRQQTGAIHGRLAATDDGTLWLVDETEGDGALAIPVELSSLGPTHPGQRLLVWGSWARDAAGTWQFRGTRGARLGGGRSAEQGYGGRLVIAPGELGPDAQPPSARDGAGEIVFVVVAAPRRYGDGWLVADPGQTEPTARLILPGERRTYGAQSRPEPAERWALGVGRSYAVGIRRFRRRVGAMPVLRAAGVPRQLPTPPN